MKIVIAESERLLHSYTHENREVPSTSLFKAPSPKIYLVFVGKGLSLVFFQVYQVWEKKANFLSTKQN